MFEGWTPAGGDGGKSPDGQKQKEEEFGDGRVEYRQRDVVESVDTRYRSV